jgi:hypothetical protein
MARATNSISATFAARVGVTRPMRGVRLDAPEGLAPVEVVSYPGPNLRRMLAPRGLGAAAWAICGITHTTATKAVMQRMFDLRSARRCPGMR